MDKFLYNVFINQRAVVELGLDLDFVDMAIFDYIKSFTHSNSCMKINTEEGVFYWVSHQNIMQQMPMLGIKTPQGIINRINKLVDAGLLKKYSKCEQFGKSLYSFGETYDLYEGFDTPKDNFRAPSTKIERNIYTNEELPLDIDKSIPSPEGEDEEFIRFYNLFGKKTQRIQALRMWKKLTRKDKDEIMQNVTAYVQSTPDVQYRMNPATYINPANKRWQDELRVQTEQIQNHVTDF